MGKRWAIVLGVAATGVLLAGCSDDTAGSEETLNFNEVDKGSTFTPIGDSSERGVPPGSGFAISVPLQDSSGKTVGELNATCIATQPGKRLNGTCSGTADVPDGQLALNVGGEVGDDVSGAIVGGTGKYAGATGTFSSQSSGEGSKDTFNITLP